MMNLTKTALILALYSALPAMASQQSISNNAFNNKADGVTSTITVVGDTIDDTIASDTADEEISATTLVDDSTNNEGDITSGEVTGATGSDQTAIESIRQDSHGNSVYNLSNYARRANLSLIHI